MADLIPLVQTYIGPIAKPKHLNYYSALGLEELTDDRGAIALAIESAIGKLKTADRTQDPKGFEEVVKIVRHARVTLLDGDKKGVYDTQLKALLKKVAPSVLGEDSQLLTESARLKELLPTGDPSAPFSLTDFLKSRPDDITYETVAQRQEALRPLLVANPFDMTTANSRNLPNITDEGAQTSSSPSPGLLPGVLASPSSTGAPKAPASRSVSSKLLQEQLRRNRRQKNLITGGIVIGGSLLLVGFGLWMFLNSRAEQQAIIAKRAANQLARSNQNQTTPVENSGSINEPNAVADVGQKPNRLQESKRMNLGISRDTNKSSAGSDSPMQLPTVGGTEPATEQAKEMATDMATNKALATPEQPPMKQPTKDMSMEDNKPAITPAMDSKKLEAWVAAMNAALNAIKKRDTQLFESEIEKAMSATEEPGKVAQSENLNLIGQLVPMSEKAFRDGYASLRATNAISLGSSQASIVEVTPESLVVRDKGKNERLEFDKLPMEWVLAIANLELSDTPVDDAVRGTLLQWDQRATADSKAAAKKFFDKAASKDKKFSNLEQIFNSQYK